MPRSLIAELRALVSAAAGRAAPFALGVGRLSWLGDRHAAVLAADVTRAEPLDELHDRLEAGLDALGFDREHRRFRPHLTIARPRRSFRPDRRSLAAIAESPSGLSWQVDALTLFESHLGPDRARHEPLHVARLGG